MGIRMQYRWLSSRSRSSALTSNLCANLKTAILYVAAQYCFTALFLQLFILWSFLLLLGLILVFLLVLIKIKLWFLKLLAFILMLIQVTLRFNLGLIFLANFQSVLVWRVRIWHGVLAFRSLVFGSSTIYCNFGWLFGSFLKRDFLFVKRHSWVLLILWQSFSLIHLFVLWRIVLEIRSADGPTFAAPWENGQIVVVRVIRAVNELKPLLVKQCLVWHNRGSTGADWMKS